MNDEQKIDNMEIVLSSMSQKEIAELVVYQKDTIENLKEVIRRMQDE